MRVLMRVAIAAIAAMAALALSAPAFSHQTVIDRGAAVRLHVFPDDEPIAGQPATLWIVNVKTPKGGKFTFNTCACRVKVTTASGQVLLDQRAGRPRTSFVFPEAAAYQIAVSGRYRTKSRRFKRFSAAFAIRAS